MNITVRPFEPEDYPALAAIHNSQGIVWPERPTSADGWAERDHRRNPKYIFKRFSALLDGKVAGFGHYGHIPGEFHPQKFHVNIEVLPERQRRGLGSALHDRIMADMQVHTPRILRADAFANLPQGYRFLERHGFREVFRETPVHLDIQAFDPTPYAGLEAELERNGYRIHTLGELAGDPQRDRRLYDLYNAIERDLPREEPLEELPPFEDWLSWAVNSPSVLPEAFFITVKDGEYIGLRELGVEPGGSFLLGGLLGVLPAHRRQRIGLAMQLRGIAYARREGYPLLKTCTAIQNAPMQALFNKLGYGRDPEWQQCQKDL